MGTAADQSPGRPLRPLDLSVLVLAGAEVIWILAAAWIPLFPDEMYYWEWSRHLAAGYFDHPPAIAWLIRGGTMLLGATAIGVRLPSIVCGMIAALGVQASAAELGGAEARARAAGIFVALPLLSGVFILATPDAPLLAAVSWALYAVLRATRPGPAPSLRWWLIAGGLLGAGFLSKYTLVLVPAGVALAAALHRPLRRLYATPGPYLAVLLAAAVIVPLLAWNAGHDWISFRFQLAHGLGAPRGGSALDREVSFLGGQLGLASPILLAMLAWATGRSLRDGASPRAVLLAGVVGFAFAFFAWSASRKPVEANWPALAYPAAIVLLAAAPLQGRGRRWLVAGQALGVGLTLIALLLVATPVVTFREEPEATAQAYGWPEVAAAVAQEAAGFQGEGVSRDQSLPGCRGTGLSPAGTAGGLRAQHRQPPEPVRSLARLRGNRAPGRPAPAGDRSEGDRPVRGDRPAHAVFQGGGGRGGRGAEAGSQRPGGQADLAPVRVAGRVARPGAAGPQAMNPPSRAPTSRGPMLAKAKTSPPNPARMPISGRPESIVPSTKERTARSTPGRNTATAAVPIDPAFLPPT
jgi:4-amino-4-deoxy-L-arabinose transferase-like glycosyltransferase